MFLNATLVAIILNGFARVPSERHVAWTRRQYAGMYIHTDAFRDVRADVRRAFPNHTITFDVVFESRDTAVPWHTDDESLGPFRVPRVLAAVRERHFVTLHAQLLASEARLHTLEWPRLSWAHTMINRRFRIFSAPQRALARVTDWVGARAARRTQGGVGVFHAFNNLALHAVTRGRPDERRRVSYAVRLVRDDVLTSAVDVRRAAGRSTACRAFEALLPLFHDDAPQPVARVAWGSAGHGR